MGRREWAGRPPETSLYAPVKAFLEGQGYVVKGEIGRCDVMAMRGAEPPVIVELKTALTLELLLQGIDRLNLSDAVYLAVPAPRGSSPLFDGRFRKLLRRVGLGLLVVHASAKVEAILDPRPYRPRLNKRRTSRLLGEFQRRTGDPNQGGSTHRVKLVTAYRQEALRVASVLDARGPQKPAALRIEAEAPNAGRILMDDVYGWFERVQRGVYTLTPAGRAGLQAFDGRFVAPKSLAAPQAA
ncbi:MAG TPA: DUF2161 family putative PD-(D/E)XK-type phosphodiesterase [Alphaproteobacteria bacterium]